MNTQSLPTQSPNRNLERRVQRMLGRRREPAALTAGQDTAASVVVSPDRRDAARPASGGRILRRWSVSDLIARAGGAPRAFA